MSTISRQYFQCFFSSQKSNTSNFIVIYQDFRLQILYSEIGNYISFSKLGKEMSLPNKDKKNIIVLLSKQFLWPPIPTNTLRGRFHVVSTWNTRGMFVGYDVNDPLKRPIFPIALSYMTKFIGYKNSFLALVPTVFAK